MKQNIMNDLNRFAGMLEKFYNNNYKDYKDHVVGGNLRKFFFCATMGYAAALQTLGMQGNPDIEKMIKAAGFDDPFMFIMTVGFWTAHENSYVTKDHHFALKYRMDFYHASWFKRDFSSKATFMDLVNHQMALIMLGKVFAKGPSFVNDFINVLLDVFGIASGGIPTTKLQKAGLIGAVFSLVKDLFGICNKLGSVIINEYGAVTKNMENTLINKGKFKEEWNVIGSYMGNPTGQDTRIWESQFLGIGMFCMYYADLLNKYVYEDKTFITAPGVAVTPDVTFEDMYWVHCDILNIWFPALINKESMHHRKQTFKEALGDTGGEFRSDPVETTP
jgi:hypothetical protein